MAIIRIKSESMDLSDDYTFTGTVEGAGGGIFESQLLHVRDEKANGTEGGSSSVGNNTRELNTVITNEITGASLSSNVITLPSGTFYIIASAPSFRPNNHKLVLYNTSDAANTIVGTNGFAAGGYNGHTRSFVTGRFTIAAQKNFEFRHYFTLAKADNGLGILTNSGDIEVYTDVQIWKVA